MLTTRAAARLLSQANDAASLTAALGFGPLHSLDRAQRQRFGVDLDAKDVRIAAGSGTLRALCLTLSGDRSPRDRATAVCRQLSREAPGNLWLLVATAHDRIILAAPPPGGGSTIAAMEVDPAQVRESDAETFAALVGSVGALDLVVHLRWRETLGRDALSRRFYRELEQRLDALADTAEGKAPAAARRTIALLHTSRLLFLAFLEVRGWLDADREFLRTHFTRCGGGGGGGGKGSSSKGAHRRLLEPLFFGTLNTPPAARAAAARAFGRVPFLNGGLFSRTPVEGRFRTLHFTDQALGELIGGLLGRYRLTARETTAAWSDAAVDPEMLGRAFESLMHPDTRRAQGAFYTPPPLIARLTRVALEHCFAARGVPPGLLLAAREGAALTPPARAALQHALRGVRVLDPACGSGAFLVFALEELAALHRAAGDGRAVSTVRRETLARTIFGVDLNPTAVWLCQLRLWLSVVVDDETEDPLQLPPLPNLDRNIREGDALAGMGFEDASPGVAGPVATLRLRYSRATGGRKRTLAHALDRLERQRAGSVIEMQLARLTVARRELLHVARSPDLFRTRRGLDRVSHAALAGLRAAVHRAHAALRTLRDGGALPFSFATHFPEAARVGGFSLVVGNPPWVRTHAIPAEQRVALRERFVTFRRAAWSAGAQAAAAGRGFASQADLAALFTERALRLTAPGGALALLLPSKLWIALAGGGVRELLAADAPPLLLEEWSRGTAGFDAAVYPSALVAQRVRPSAPDIQVIAHRGDAELAWSVGRTQLALDDSPGAPWLLVPSAVREAFDTIGRAGRPLAESAFGRPLLGVKSGCNDAFVVSHDEAVRESLEPECLRPLLRAEHLLPFRIAEEGTHDAIIWTHDARGAPRATLPPRIRQHLNRFRRTLELRTDGRIGHWWSLFRTEAARSDRPRVVWGDISRAPRAIVLSANDETVPLNSCYVVRAPSDDDAYALATLFNTPVGAAWLSVIAEPARGGYHRFLGWTTARFPLPRQWDRVRAELAAVGRAGARGELPDRWTLTTLALEAYGVRHDAIAPLLSWHFL